MERHEVVSRFLAMFAAPSYLEIGVNQGITFNQLKASLKVAVDPIFQFDTLRHASESVHFHPVTSDDFFGRIAPSLPRFDVIYLDGLHTFEQTLRDLLSATVVLNERGVIIIDDVLPTSYDASLPDLDQVFKLRATTPSGVDWTTDGSWMGDVFKVPLFLRSFMQQFSYATVQENHGQTVMWRQVRPSSEMGCYTVDGVARMDFRDTILRRSAFNILPLGEIARLVQKAS